MTEVKETITETENFQRREERRIPDQRSKGSEKGKEATLDQRKKDKRFRYKKKR